MPGIVYKISGDNSQFQKDINQSEHIAQGGFDKITALGLAAWAAIGAAIIKVTSAGIGFLKDSVNVGMGFDKSMSQVAATMGTTVDSIQDLSSFALEMGATTAFSAQQAADGLNILAQSGLAAEDQMKTLPDVLNLAAAGNLSLAESASYVTGAIKGYGDSFDNASKYTDLIATGAAQANTNVSQLGAALSGSAASASSYGQTVEETTLALLRLAEQNVTGAEASTALNRAMMDLYTPTDAAKKAMQKLGVSAYDATGKARPLNDVVDELTAAMDGMSDAEKNATKNTIFSTFGLQAYNKMAVSTTEKVNGFKKALDQSAGSAQKMSEVQLDNLSGDITLAKSAAEGFKIAISNGVTPAIRTFVQKGTTELGKLKSAFEKDGLSGLATQFAKSLVTMGKEVVKYIPEALKAGAEFGKSLLSGLVEVFSPAKIMRAASNLLSNLGNALLKDSPKIGEKVGQLIAETLTNLPTLLETGAKFIKNLFDGMIKALPGIAEGVKKGFNGMFEGPISDEAQAVYDELDDMQSKFEEFMDSLTNDDRLKDLDATFEGASRWLDIFDELANKTDLTKEEQLKLKTAVEQLNAILPETQQIVQDETGKWSLNTEEIKKNLDALKQRSLAEVYLEKGKDILRQIVDLESKVTTETDLAGAAFKRAFDKKKEANELSAAWQEIISFISTSKEYSEGLSVALEDLPKPVQDIATEWGITGRATTAQIDAIIASLVEQEQQLRKDAKAAEDEGKAHQEAANRAKDGIAQLESAYDTMMNKANQALNQSAKAEAQGSATGAGYAKGIASQVNAVIISAQRLASAATSTIGRRMEIKSPSKVTQRLGKFVTEGLAVGIGDETEINKVEQSAEKAADAGLSALTSSIDSSISASPVTGTESGKIDMIITLLTTYLPEMGGDVVLDTGALVGHTIGRTDAELGQLQKRRARYE